VTIDVAPVPRPDWTPVPHPDAHGVESKALLHADDMFLALLRFGENATIHEHAAPHEIVAICLEGEGLTSVGGKTATIRAGERVVWPAGAAHRLWTAGSPMLTLMVERPAPS
jgi:quercetin dioxygenase-like cupin family protein